MSNGKRKELSRRQEFKEKRRKRQRQQQTVTLAIIGAGILVVLGLLIVPSLIPAGDVNEAVPLTRQLTQDNTMGNPDAPVTIVEYSDFQCPACLAFHEQTESLLVEQYINTGKVHFIYRSMGTWIGAESAAAAEAAYCASDQGKFWDYHDILFANQQGENVGGYKEKRLLAFAENLGLNMSDFRACLSSDKYADRVAQDRLDGEQQGVSATPTFFVNAELVRGAIDFNQLSSMIEAKLATSSSP
jgi:protein-disulfide isomerase